MNKEELKKVLDSMSLYEKIGQLVLLGGHFFNKNVDIFTGPVNNLGIDPKIIPYAGFSSNLPLETLYSLQKEKILNGKVPLCTCSDVIHGYKTIFPIPLALSASFNMNLVKKCASIWAKEASSGAVFISFGPMLDLSRDARWGRVMESFGEDPVLGSAYAKAYIKGMQGNLKDEGSLGATVKHFAGYSLPEGGRDYQMSNISSRIFNDFYLPPYISGIKEKPLMVMSGFNAVDLLPTVANKELIYTYLRKKLKFKGVLISDYNAIHELVNHRLAKNDKEAALIAFKSGITVDLMSSCYSNYLKELVEEGSISIEELDERVMLVLELKNKLSLFENPYRFSSINYDYQKHLAWAYKAALESMVLLKNEENILPLKSQEKVLFVGPFVNEEKMYGSWSFNRNKDITTILDSFKKHNYGEYETYFTENIYDCSLSEVEQEELNSLAKKASKVVFLVGEQEEDSGEAASKTNINLSSNICKMIQEVSLVNPNIVSVIFGGRPLVITEIDKISKGLMYAFFPGTMGSKALLDLLYGLKNPSAKLPMSIPYAIGQIPIYYQSYPSGRPYKDRIEENRYFSHYLDAPNTPLYSFGEGISYSKFAYSNLIISKESINRKEKIAVSVDVSNVSEQDGDEIILLYIRDVVSSLVKPEKELKAFKKAHIKAHERKTINFSLDPKCLEFSGLNNKKMIENGEYIVIIDQLQKSFILE